MLPEYELGVRYALLEKAADIDPYTVHSVLRRLIGAGLGGYLGYRYGGPAGDVVGNKLLGELIGGGGGAILGGALPEVPGIVGGSILGANLGSLVGGTAGKGSASLISQDVRTRETGEIAGKAMGVLAGTLGGAAAGKKLFTALERANQRARRNEPLPDKTPHSSS